MNRKSADLIRKNEDVTERAETIEREPADGV